MLNLGRVYIYFNEPQKTRNFHPQADENNENDGNANAHVTAPTRVQRPARPAATVELLGRWKNCWWIKTVTGIEIPHLTLGIIFDVWGLFEKMEMITNYSFSLQKRMLHELEVFSKSFLASHVLASSSGLVCFTIWAARVSVEDS